MQVPGSRAGQASLSRRPSSISILAVFVLCNLWYFTSHLHGTTSNKTISIPYNAAVILKTCQSLHLKPGPPDDFYQRETSDRFQSGTKPILIRNATIWTGRVNGLEILSGDILLQGGIIKQVGPIGGAESTSYETIDAQGAWVTPGIIDVHSHLGVESSPALAGANDGNSVKGLTLPWLRSLDALNTHDDGYASSVAGGLTTALILPGSANAIGGQAFVIKLRPTSERSSSAMLLEPPFDLNYTYENDRPLRWRHMKHACGENPSGVYSGTRMDTFWAFRQAYDTARKIKASQDEYCQHALAGNWNVIDKQQFPESLQWEALVDVLRGRVKVQTHCYEAVDIDDFVRLSNEFQFPVAAFHHAHEAWLVPDVLKRAFEHPPAVAMFAAFARYKREAYRHSEFAPRVLADNDIDVIMKSDHPAIVSRYLIHEAAQAHYFGLEKHIALSSVITTPAKVLGLDHRIGYIKPGYDADVVIWDSHPLALGATPTQVIIDGIPQLSSPYTVPKPASQQHAPITPDFDQEAENAVKYEGLPPLDVPFSTADTVIFTNVASILTPTPDGNSIVEAFSAPLDKPLEHATVVVQNGRIACQGTNTTWISKCFSFIEHAYEGGQLVTYNLQGGALQPGLVSAGSNLGLQHIAFEASTVNGMGYDPLEGDPPLLVGGEGYIPLAIDGLQFGTRDALLAYRAGVTVAITAPAHGTFLGGVSAAFATQPSHRLEDGAIVQEIAALHVALSHGGFPSLSTAVSALRSTLLHPPSGEAGLYVRKVTHGKIPLVVETNNADIIATVIQLKAEVEEAFGHSLKVTIVGGAEAHLLAIELAKADVGVLLMPPRPYPYTWDRRRILSGPPLTNESTIAHLIRSGVTVGIGPQGTSAEPIISTWAVRNLRFDVGWALLDSPHILTRASALTLGSSNVLKLLGIHRDPYEHELVATVGGDLLSFEGKIAAIISPSRGKVDFLDKV